MKAVLVSSSIAIAAAQQKGTMTAENHPQLSWSTCTAPGQCQSKQGKVVIDANWRWTHKKGETTNCYTGNKWDSSICPDAKTCSQNFVMSLWDDHYANMLWLDSTYPVDSTDPGASRGPCSTDSGVPKDVESAQANSHVIFSDIKFGPIGSTTASTPSPSPTPTPSPTPPAPSPTPGGCPGGSLSACIDLCPADVFAPCVESCQKRCSSVLV